MSPAAFSTSDTKKPASAPAKDSKAAGNKAETGKSAPATDKQAKVSVGDKTTVPRGTKGTTASAAPATATTLFQSLVSPQRRMNHG